MAANPGLVTVFGASGFLGRYVVRALTARGWRVRAAVRNPHTSHELKVMGDVGQVQGEGEAHLREHVPSADILRPSIVFGAEDDFFNRFAKMTSFAPALPLIGGGKTKFQPVFVEDVANAVAISVTRGTSGQTYELGGPQTYTFKALLEFILETVDKKRLLAPMPWFAANMMGFGGELSAALPFVKPFLTRDQVKNLKVDNVVAADAAGFEAFDIRPETIEAIVPSYLAKYRKYGQFYEKRQTLDDAV